MKPATRQSQRYWEVDFARGIAIIMVVLYHLIYDLDNFAGYPIASTSGFWGAFANVSAFAFVFLVGLSLTLSHARASEAAPNDSLFSKYLLRGLRIFGYGMAITFVFWAFGIGAVIFGILHLIGVSIILAYPFLKLRLANLISGIAIILAGFYVHSRDFIAAGVAGIMLAPFGVLPEGLFMPDYRPLLPWFGVVLLGLFFGNVVYLPWRKRSHIATPPYTAPISFLGRHTLLIYLVHQPIFFAVLWALGMTGPSI